jgi:periplasmic protein CpxP/Spy
MSSITHPLAVSMPLARSIAIAALLGATFLASPLIAAPAHSATAAPVELAQNEVAAATAATPAESVEQRITSLHASLKITADEDAKWNNVAQAMRENATALQKLAADRTSQAPQSMTAVQDLKGYEKFAQQHVNGLKNLISSFETLYNAMPDDQKKIADQVFENSGRERGPSRS